MMFPLRKIQIGEELKKLLDIHAKQLMDILSADRDAERILFQLCAAAVGAALLGHILLYFVA